MGPGACLEYVPDHLIPSPGARLHQSTEITLAAGASAIVWDAWSAGRPARGEAWAFAELDLRLDIRDGRGPVCHERARLEGDAFWSRLGGAEGMSYAGVFLAVTEGRADWEAAARGLEADLGAEPCGARVGVTALGRGGVLARVLAPSAPALIGAGEALWAASRRRLFDLPPLRLRKL